MQRLRSIQVLRAIAACAVVFFHTYDPGGAGHGALGVDLFFVISGFIMANISTNRTWTGFASDRLWRIFPMWWIAVLPWLVLVPLPALHQISSLTLWPVFGEQYFVPALRIGWTLSFELLFYAAVALAIATRPAIPIVAYLLLLAGTVAVPSTWTYFLGSPMCLEFLMGIVVARLPRRASLGLLVPGGIALVSLTPQYIGDLEASLEPFWALWRAFSWGIPAALIVWGSLSLEPWFKTRIFNGAVALGDASYSIYLFHALVSYGFSIWWPLRLALAIGTGIAMHIVAERKILALRKARPASTRHTSRLLDTATAES